MNNMPIISSAPQANSKPAPTTQAAASANHLPATQAVKSASGGPNHVQTAKPAQASKTAEESSPQGKSFGDVLARQVSDASTDEDVSQPKKTAPKSADEIFANIKAKTSGESADTASNNAPDMLATLIPLNTAAQNMQGSSATTAAENSPISQDSDISSKKGTPGKISKAGFPDVPSDAMIPGTVSNAISPVVAGEAMAQGVAGKAVSRELVGEATADDSVSKAASRDLPGNAKDIFGLEKFSPTLANTALSQTTPPVDAKKDSAFSNMMDTITASTAAKLSGADDKAAALAAAPQPNAGTQAAMQAATAAPLAPGIVMPAQVTINTPVSHEKWGDEFNQKITWLSSQKEQTAELHLNPPQLGPMDVVLKVSGDQATALFTSPHAAVREAVEQALPRLREMLADSGIMLGNATVSDQAPRNRQDSSEHKSSGPRTGIGGIGTLAASHQSVRVTPISRHNGMVDTFA